MSNFRTRTSEVLAEGKAERGGEYPSVQARKPGFIKRFFTGFADFIIFGSQVVRVKKWKICPLVELDVNENLG